MTAVLIDTTVTVLSTFVPLPGMADRLVDAMLTNSAEVLVQQDGFLGNRILRSSDSAQVVNLAVWRDESALRQLMQDPSARTAMAQQRALAASVTVQVLHPVAETAERQR